MLPLLRSFVADVLRAVETPDPVVEFGSLQVEPGQDADLRPLFAGRPYTGTDFRAGPGVDRVEDLRPLTLEDSSVGTALCLETLEHCRGPVHRRPRAGAGDGADGGVCLVSTPLLLGSTATRTTSGASRPRGCASSCASSTTSGCTASATPGCRCTSSRSPRGGASSGCRSRRCRRWRDTQRRYLAAPDRVRIGALRLEPRELAGTLAREARRLAAARLKR